MPTSTSERPLTPKSLVLDLLSVVREHALPVRTLVRAAEPMGISGNGLRVALSRLRAEGKVCLVRRGSYALSPAARKRNQQVLAWGEVPLSRVAWEGDWLGAVPAGGERDDRALCFMGFAPLTPALYVRPDNLRGGLEVLRGQLRELGLAANSATFKLRDLDAATEFDARALWDAGALARRHREMAAALRDSARALQDAPDDQALREMFLLGGRAIRQIVLDPRLPDELASPAPLTALVKAMRDYDVRGRKLWARYLDLGEDALLPAAPADWSSLRARLPASAANIREAS